MSDIVARAEALLIAVPPDDEHNHLSDHLYREIMAMADVGPISRMVDAAPELIRELVDEVKRLRDMVTEGDAGPHPYAGEILRRMFGDMAAEEIRAKHANSRLDELRAALIAGKAIEYKEGIITEWVRPNDTGEWLHHREVRGDSHDSEWVKTSYPRDQLEEMLAEVLYLSQMDIVEPNE